MATNTDSSLARRVAYGSTQCLLIELSSNKNIFPLKISTVFLFCTVYRWTVSDRGWYMKTARAF